MARVRAVRTGVSGSLSSVRNGGEGWGEEALRSGETAGKGKAPRSPTLSPFVPHGARETDALLAHAEDATDHNLPLMYWFATEPIVAASPLKGALLLGKAKIPLLREYITRRMTAK